MKTEPLAVIQLTREDIDSRQDMKDLDGPEFAQYLEGDLERALEKRDILANVYVQYMAQDEGAMPPIVIAETEHEKNEIKETIRHQISKSWRAFMPDSE